MIFPDGGPEIVPAPTETPDDLHLLRTSTLFPGEGPDLSAFGPIADAERPKTADDRGDESVVEQSPIKPEPSRQVSAPQLTNPTVQNNETDPEPDPAPDQAGMSIGMALGDPDEDLSRHTKEEEDPVEQTSPNEPLKSISLPTPLPESRLDGLKINDGNITLKQKSSRWKIWGGLFGKKAADAASPTTHLQQKQTGSTPASRPRTKTMPSRTQPPQRSDMPSKMEGSGASRGKGRIHRMQSARLTKSKEGTRPDFKRARTAPFLRSEEKRPHPPNVANAEKPFPKLQLEGQPMLSIDIPNVQLERYSVMFDSLLKPTPSSSSSSSLLVRRNAHLDNVRTDGAKNKVTVSLIRRVHKH